MKLKGLKHKLTKVELKEFEEEHNFNLPQSYRNLILRYNGGVPEKRYFRGGEVYFMPIKYHIESNINETIRIADYLPKGYFPFADYNTMFLCICLEPDDYGTIYHFNDDGELHDVCDSFEDFLEELSDDSDY